MIKAVFFDIDGTLLTSKGTLSPLTIQGIKDLRKNGIKCFIASGRGPMSIDSLVGELDLDGYVLFNGQLVFSHDKGIYQNPFPTDTVKDLAIYGDLEDKQMIFGGRKTFYGSESMKIGQKKWINALTHVVSKSTMFKIADKGANLYPSADLFIDLPIFDQPIYQVVMKSPLEEQATLEKEFPTCTITRSNPFSVDIIPKGGSKLKGIEKMVEYFGIELSETMAFGDNFNDVEMLRGVGLGIAMGNSPEQVKVLADEVAGSNDEDGIYYMLAKQHLIGQKTK